MPAHRDRIGRSDQTVRRSPRQIGDAVLAGMAQRAGIEGNDLVAGEIGVHEARGREFVVDVEDRTGVDAEVVEDLAIGSKVDAGRANERRPLAEERQIIGDVSADPAPAANERIDQEADRQDVRLVRDDVVVERSREGHDVVVRK